MRPTARFGLLVCLSFAAPARALDVSLDASAGGKNGVGRVAFAAWLPVVRIGSRLAAGAGARAWGIHGDAVPYENRDASSVAFPPRTRIDPAVYALDAAVFGEVKLLDAVSIGANLDLVGVATGPTRRTGALEAKPQTFSYFAFGDADHGALGSEFYVSVRPAARIHVRAGVTHFVANYDVKSGAAPGSTRRYQRFETAPFAAVALRF